jgi:hypothetical protein
MLVYIKSHIQLETDLPKSLVKNMRSFPVFSVRDNRPETVICRQLAADSRVGLLANIHLSLQPQMEYMGSISRGHRLLSLTEDFSWHSI